MNRSIIVVAPVKNEGWIIRSFLNACCEFADAIVLLDQNSIDETVNIASTFHKVILFENSSNEFNEKERAELLLRLARDRFGDNHVIVALDADEIPINTQESLEEWNFIRSLDEDTTVLFEKPDLLQGGVELANFPQQWPLAFIDNGKEFVASQIHTARVPQSSRNIEYIAKKICFIHLNLVRPKVLRAKRRMYCVVENVKGIQPLWRRLETYDRKIKFDAIGERVAVPHTWISSLNRCGVFPECIADTEFAWQNYAVLQAFKKYGTFRFFLDDVWDADWCEIRESCLEQGHVDIPEEVISPPRVAEAVRYFIRWMIAFVRCCKRAICRKNVKWP